MDQLKFENDLKPEASATKCSPEGKQQPVPPMFLHHRLIFLPVPVTGYFLISDSWKFPMMAFIIHIS